MKEVLFLTFCCLIGSIVCPPVKPAKHEKQGPPRNEEMKLGLQYEKYLKEIVNVLEEDESFKKKLENSNISDIKNGKIADHLEFVNHKIRSKLDELKRNEVDRLNQLKKLLEHQRNLKSANGFKPKMPGFARNIPDISGKVVDAMLKAQGIDDPKKVAEDHDHHIDMKNPETFEVDDLKRLIVKATSDLEKIDKVRKGEFKRYELEKEHLRREKLRHMSEKEKKEAEAEHAALKKKHQDHPKVHHPGNKAQLEEVWEETDGMKKEDFDPKTFFFMHDTNGDMLLDEEELEALFQKELDKVYDPNNPEDDMVERYEEMNRMREHVQDEVDKDGDGLVSLEEFLDSTHKAAFDKDPEWKTLDEDDEWSEEEIQEYERERARQMEHAQAGEVNIPVVQPSVIPQVNDGNLHFQGQPQGQDHLQGQAQGQPVQMHQGYHTKEFDAEQQMKYRDTGAPAYDPIKSLDDMPPRQIKTRDSLDHFGEPDQQAQHQAQQTAQQAAQEQAAQQQAAQQAQQQAAQQQAAQQQAAQQQAAQQQAAQQQAAQQQAAQQQAQQQAAQQQAQQQAAQQQAQQQAAQQQAQHQESQQQAQQPVQHQAAQQAPQPAAQQQAQQPHH